MNRKLPMFAIGSFLLVVGFASPALSQKTEASLLTRNVDLVAGRRLLKNF